MLDFLSHLGRANLTTVLFVDEFDYLIGSDELDASFYAGLRSVISTNLLSIVTASTTGLPELLQGREGAGSPLWDLLLPVYLSLFEPSECTECITACTKDTGYDFTVTELLEISTRSGGHPFLLQYAGNELYRAYQLGLSEQERVAYLHENWTPFAGSLFNLYWQKSTDEHKIVLASLALLEANDSTRRSFNTTEVRELYSAPDATFIDLQRRALLRQSAAGKYQLLSPVLARWIIAELTASKNERMDYESWLQGRPSVTSQLSAGARKQLAFILPRIASNYRDLFIAWVSDPKHLVHVATLLGSVLGHG